VLSILQCCSMQYSPRSCLCCSVCRENTYNQALRLFQSLIAKKCNWIRDEIWEIAVGILQLTCWVLLPGFIGALPAPACCVVWPLPACCTPIILSPTSDAPVRHEHRARLCCPAQHKHGAASAAHLPARFVRATARRSTDLAAHSRQR